MSLSAQAEAAKREAMEKGLEVEFKGITYKVPPAKQWDLEAMEAYEDGKPITCVRAVLGPEQWATFKGTGPQLDDFHAFTAALFNASGTSEGESEG